MEYLTAEQVLNIIEKIMIDSGTRAYCADVCKGECCGGCYSMNPDACHHCEGRRLSCSFYLCPEITLYLNKQAAHDYWRIRDLVMPEYRKFVSKNKSPYYCKPMSNYFKEAKFPIEIEQLADTVTEGLTKVIQLRKNKS